MTALRQHFIELLHSQGMSDHTQKMYVRAVRQLAEYYHRPPDQLNDEQIHQFLRYLKEGKQLADGTVMQLLCGIKLFYTQILEHRWTPFSQHSAQAKTPPTPIIAQARMSAAECLNGAKSKQSCTSEIP